MPLPNQKADVCLILEGTYPYVSGGVASWAHKLISDQSHLTFHLCTIVPRQGELEMKYSLPSNVIGMTTIRLNDMPKGAIVGGPLAHRVHHALREPLAKLTNEAPMTLADLKKVMDVLSGTRAAIGTELLLDHEKAWEQLLAIYEEFYNDHSFLDYFWSYRALVGGLYSMLLAPLPKADVYHALSTGYAGLMAARAKIETGKPVITTEHGIYTNERRIEVATAEWLDATSSKALTIDKPRRDLRDMWIDSIHNLSRLCYDACDHIVTVYEGNQKSQLEDGAPLEKMQIIPNGVDTTRYGRLAHPRRPDPTIALIGRVVPIKDVKTFIRSVGLLRQTLPDITAYIMGPTEENPDYYAECVRLVELMGLERSITFTGQVQIDEYLPLIDVVVLTSISEAQPLVILEAGAAGIPVVATDVGAIRELLEGITEEDKALGLGGVVTSLASPAATADGVFTLLTDPAFYGTASVAIRERTHRYYDEKLQQQAYRNLYAEHLG